MKWLRPLYVGKHVEGCCRRVMAVIEKGEKGAFGFCQCLMLSTHTEDYVDITPAGRLRNRFYADKDVVILGLAVNRREARLLVLQMAEDAVAAIGKPDIRAYVESLPETAFTDRGEVSLSLP